MDAEKIIRHIAACRPRLSVRLLDVIYGPDAKALRTTVAAMMLDRKVTGSDKVAQYGNLRAALLQMLGATGGCKAAEDAHFEERARVILGESNAEAK